MDARVVMFFEDLLLRSLPDGSELWLQPMLYGKARLYLRLPETPEDVYDDGW